MPINAENEESQPPADHFIELNTLIPERRSRTPSPMRRPAPPKLQLNTADLPSDTDEPSATEPAPKSAILGLVLNNSSAIETWLPTQEPAPAGLSPAKRLDRGLTPSSSLQVPAGSHSSGSRRSSVSRAPSRPSSRRSSSSRNSSPSHARSPISLFPWRRPSDASSYGTVDPHDVDHNLSPELNPENPFNEHLSASSSPSPGVSPVVSATLRPSVTDDDTRPMRTPSPIQSKPFLSIPKSPPGGIRAGSQSNPWLTVERSFHNAPLESPVHEFLDTTFAPDDAEQKRLRSTKAAPELTKMKRRASLDAALARAENNFLEAPGQTDDDDSHASEHGDTSELEESDIEEYSSIPDLPEGRTLFYFTPENSVRKKLFSLLETPAVYYGTILLTILQVIGLIIDLHKPFTVEQDMSFVYNEKFGFVMMAFYAIYTIRAACECIAYGVLTTEIMDWPMFSTNSWWWIRKLCHLVTLGAIPSPKPLYHSRVAMQRCFLRKSWGRVEFVSIVMFWSYVGVVYGQDHESITLIVGGLAHIRILRILDYIAYTRVILQALKIAIPLLQNVLYFLAFFLTIWAIVGVQSFNGSLRRACVYGDIVMVSQKCGSWLEPGTLRKMPYLKRISREEGFIPQSTTKGYTCPVGSKCVEFMRHAPGDADNIASVSFDNIFKSLEIVFIMMSNNSFTEIMYDVIDSEYLVSSLFFISGVLVLGIWLANLTVAVMVSSYSAVKDLLEDLHMWRPRIHLSRKHIDVESQSLVQIQEKRDHGHWILKNTRWGKLYTLVYPIFALLAVADLIMQAVWNPEKGSIFHWELAVAIAFGVDIILRFLVYLPYWRYFLYSFTNWIDLTLVIFNAITLAFYHHTVAYAWLTVFQLLRIYRVVGALDFARVFWLQLFGNYKVLLNLTGFYFLTTLLCSIVACKMLRGQFPMETDGSINIASFYDLSAAFFSMYQVASTENWTDVLFWTTENVSRPGNTVIGLACMGVLFCGWLFFANFLIFNFFIGVMTENLHGAISNKREEQARSFANDFLIHSASDDNSRWYMGDSSAFTLRERLKHWLYRLRGGPTGTSVVSSSMYNTIERQFVTEFLDVPKETTIEAPRLGSTFLSLQTNNHQTATYGHLNDYSNHPIFKKLGHLIREIAQLFHHYPRSYRTFVSESIQNRREEARNESNRAYVDEIFDYQTHSLALLKRYSEKHPFFDRSLFILGPDNVIRRFCQRLFPSSYGHRVSGVYPKRWTGIAVKLFFMCATAALVVQTCINTPIHTLNEKDQLKHSWTWLRVIDLVFGTLFSIEFLGKVFADGFHFTPNAFTHSAWNLLDAIALASLWITFINDFFDGPLARYLRGIVALRSLRLVTGNKNSERLLNSIFLKGFKNLLAAGIIAMSLVVPYAIWGRNIFHDRLTFCNDGNTNYLSECQGEFSQTLFDNFDVLSPRVIEENYFSYNTFWDALMTQFGVLSLEGWTDVLEAVTAITGKGEQPETYSSKGNAAYPIVYHYLGSVLIMTMFIAVIIRNYALTMGTAYLTGDQLAWLDVKNTLKLVTPTPRPPRYRPETVRYHLLQAMPTWINYLEVWALLAATINMAAYYYPPHEYAETAYNIIMLISSTLLACLSVLRLLVLKPRLYFHNWWNPFGLLVYIAVIIFTILNATLPGYEVSGSLNSSRAAYICLLLMRIPRTKRLHEFFMIATAAVSEIAVLLETWFVLFITYAIALNQTFGLTKLGPESSSVKNFRTVPKTLIALFTMSCGEGWNQFLLDFTISPPNCLSQGSKSECGISGYAYVLFISWNVISMYVFANLFISLICEACWYIYRSGPVNIRQQDIMAFLETWQQFDPRASGFIRTTELYDFLGHTRGYFSLGIYSRDSRFSVHRILEKTGADKSLALDPYHVDMNAIHNYLADMPVEQYRERIRLYEMFTMHTEIQSEILTGGKYVPFSMLMRQFPLYKDMDPSKVLTLKEFITLKIQLHEASLALAAGVIVRKWRLYRERRQEAQDPGVAYHVDYDTPRLGSVYWMT